ESDVHVATGLLKLFLPETCRGSAAAAPPDREAGDEEVDHGRSEHEEHYQQAKRIYRISSQQSTHQQAAPSRRRRYSHPRVIGEETDLVSDKGHMLSPVRLGLADHYLFYGADLRRLGRSDRGEKRCRAFTLVSLHEGLGGGGADVGGSGGFLGHTIVFPKKEEDQFKPFFTQAMRILDELAAHGIRHPKEKSERSANKTMATVPAAVPSDRVNLRLLFDWSQAERPASNILRLIYQGRFLHRSVTLAALRTAPGGAPPDSAPERAPMRASAALKEESAAAAANGCCCVL
uniref:Rho-GAP domain-containing protein n=1 Tax=Macrostomum lignano TaxID=282301 RepID=A0A1I8FF52_9PLAT